MRHPSMFGKDIQAKKKNPPNVHGSRSISLNGENRILYLFDRNYFYFIRNTRCGLWIYRYLMNKSISRVHVCDTWQTQFNGLKAQILFYIHSYTTYIFSIHLLYKFMFFLPHMHIYGQSVRRIQLIMKFFEIYSEKIALIRYTYDEVPVFFFLLGRKLFRFKVACSGIFAQNIR